MVHLILCRETILIGPHQAARVSYPVVIKATASGGGSGIRVCLDKASLEQQWPLAQVEA
ncbi:hypothetical protein CFB84_19970 [Burkholderia aenigmatica]|uniref:Carbamoyl phosphate synthase ATP-binding domain-containing protein n=1 Tax=Burkholderia aenigmatica TaxID=2015348 RepID=A0A228IN64_9BURK|nr:hypothetical protein CFB84_19970 [Burkholderia aenigmatica]